MSDEVPSIGSVLEECETIGATAQRLMTDLADHHTARIAAEVSELSDVVHTLAVIMREHLKCHDCVVTGHTHRQAGVDGNVDKVLPELIYLDGERKHMYG